MKLDEAVVQTPAGGSCGFRKHCSGPETLNPDLCGAILESQLEPERSPTRTERPCESLNPSP